MARAECEPHADFRGASSHGVIEDAIETDGRRQDRNRGQTQHHDEEEPRGDEDVAIHFRHDECTV
jgi:hypothetical protein